MTRRCFTLVVALLLISGCAGLDSRYQHAATLAQGAQLDGALIDTDRFVLRSYRRLERRGAPLHVYIEGDGLAWLNRHTPSPDPSPSNPLALRLAAVDPAPNVAYLARPCQLVPKTQWRHCRPSDWLGGRFSEAVVAAMDRAVTQLKQQAGATTIDLIGFSGGGAIAALLAARRTDISSLRTVAGNLDSTAFTTYHRVTPMSGSLNPRDVAVRLTHLPQRHFSGGSDSIVPPTIVSAFIAIVDRDRCARQEIVAGLEHSDDRWQENWPRLLAEPVFCPGDH